MRILLGVTGGIAAYKSAEIVRAFIKRGDEVRVMMTKSAQEFISPLTLQVLSGNTVGTELFDPTYESEIGHIELARWPDVVVIAPATANTIAKLAAGMADDLLTTVVTATTAPVVVAPAMNTQMYLNKLVRRNIRTLDEAGFHIVDPDSGELACKEVGWGRLPDPDVLLEYVDAVGVAKTLADKHVVITAGPTREHIDPARFISNPSTGKMGFALAKAAAQMGAQVTLVAGPVALKTPSGVDRIDVVDAQSMYEEVMQIANSADAVICVAAVADWRPVNPSQFKREKSEMGDHLTLERTPDTLAELGLAFGPGNESGPLIVGFAAESHDVEERGQAKRKRKNAHLLVANKIGGADNAFGADENEIFFISETQTEKLPRMSKTDVGMQVMQRISKVLATR
ncbi:MAG: bifunctional phosphopantothenoylcysteine decarboxylase/phosphopantothenate--cysteine ligase CoaBC [bacterium]